MAKNDKRIKYASDDDRPVTISMRVPKELYGRLEDYAGKYQRSISEVLRKSVEGLLSAGDPRSEVAKYNHTLNALVTQMDSTQEVQELLGSTARKDKELVDRVTGSKELQELHEAVARQDAQMQALIEALQPHILQLRNGIQISKGAPRPGKQARAAAPVPERTSEDAPPAAAGKHHLGKLCPRQHDWNNSRQSLRNADNQCLECKAQAKREKRANNKAN